MCTSTLNSNQIRVKARFKRQASLLSQEIHTNLYTINQYLLGKIILIHGISRATKVHCMPSRTIFYR